MTDRTGFSATDAALTGFRIARREPLTVGVWAVVQAVILSPLSLAFNAAMAPYQAQLRASPRPDPAAAAALMAKLLPLQLVFVVIVLALLSVLFCGVYRTVLRPQAGGPGRLRLGADEGRVAASVFLLALLTLGLALVAVVVAAIAAAVLSSLAPTARGLWSVASFLVVAGALVFLAVRLSLSPTMSFATGRVTVFGSWRLTRGRFWALLGTYVVAGLLMFAVELAVFALLCVAALPLVGFGGVSALFDPNARGTAPLGLTAAFAVVGGLLSGFLVALQAGAPASAYAQLAEGGGSTATPTSSASDLPRFGR